MDRWILVCFVVYHAGTADWIWIKFNTDINITRSMKQHIGSYFFLAHQHVYANEVSEKSS